MCDNVPDCMIEALIILADRSDFAGAIDRAKMREATFNVLSKLLLYIAPKIIDCYIIIITYRHPKIFVLKNKKKNI